MADLTARKISSENTFLRTFVRSLPCLSFVLLGAILCAFTGNQAYPTLYIVFCALAFVSASVPSLTGLYKSFPQRPHADSGLKALWYILSGISALFCVTVLSFVCPLIPFSAGSTAKEVYLALFTEHTASLVCLCFSVTCFSYALFSATSFSVLLGKTFKKRRVSRTCLAAVPLFLTLAVCYVFCFFIATFFNISISSRLANQYLTEESLWFLLTLGFSSLIISPAIILASVKLSLTKKLTNTKVK